MASFWGWSARSSAFFKSKNALEAFKFTIYVSLPIGLSYAFADPDFMHKYLQFTPIVVYPKSDVSAEVASELFQQEMLLLEANRAKKLQANPPKTE